jgi:hypothetical protein
MEQIGRIITGIFLPSRTPPDVNCARVTWLV